MKHIASSKRPDPVARPDWYFPYSRMPARAPIPAIARKVKPVTSNQSWCSTLPREWAVARIAASAALPVRLRSTMLTAPIMDDQRVVLVASKGGDDRDPEWYRNLVVASVLVKALDDLGMKDPEPTEDLKGVVIE